MKILLSSLLIVSFSFFLTVFVLAIAAAVGRLNRLRLGHNSDSTSAQLTQIRLSRPSLE